MQLPSQDVSGRLIEAYVLLEKKQEDAAFAAVNALMKQFPLEAEPVCLLIAMYIDHHDEPKAMEIYNTSQVKLNPADADFINGVFFQAQAKYQEAINAYENALKKNPNYVYAHYRYGKLSLMLRRYQQAFNHFEKVIHLAPIFYFAYFYSGLCALNLNKLDLALMRYQEVLKYDPDDSQALCHIGITFLRMRKFNEAIISLEKAIKINPKSAAAHSNIGTCYLGMDEPKKAEYYIRQALIIKPESPEDWRRLSMIVTFTQEDKLLITQMKTLSENPNITKNDKMFYDYAMAKVYQDLHEYDKAFAYYQKANSYRALKFPFYLKVYSDHIKDIIKAYESLKFKHFNFNEQADFKPLFIFGLPRSGKTLLEKILVQNKQIASAGEVSLQEILTASSFNSRWDVAFSGWIGELSAKKAQYYHDIYMQKLIKHRKENARFVIDTAPEHFRFVGILQILFPEAKFIFFERNTMDVCVDTYFKYFNDGYGHSYDLKHIGEFYGQYQIIMQYWLKEFPNNILKICYEDLILKPQETLTKVMQYLELEQHFKYDFSHLNANYINHWKHYQKHLGPLLDVFRR